MSNRTTEKLAQREGVPVSNRSEMFKQSELRVFRDDLENTVWELMMNNNVDRKTILRMVDEAIEAVEFRIGEAGE